MARIKKPATIATGVGGGVLLWRRGRIKDDARRVAEVATGLTDTARLAIEDRVIAKRTLYGELGYLVHALHRDPDRQSELQPEIDRALSALDDSMAEEEPADEGTLVGQ